MLRKLASIQRVLSLSPIDGADFIEVARINGWNCIVKKGEFKEGDLGVYFEIDAVPPDTETYAFLKTKPDGTVSERTGSFRIRTKKLKGVVSQGLLLPIGNDETVTEMQMLLGIRDTEGKPTGKSICEDEDVTELLGVTKYDPPEFTGGNGFKRGRTASNFPTYLVSKTDEQRVQSATKLLWELAGKPWVATLKLDGTSFTAAYDAAKQKVLTCSRNFVVEETEEIKSLYVDMANKYGLLQKLAEPMFQELAVQGEIVGPGIQGNKLGLKEPELRLFRIVNTTTRRPVTQGELEKYAALLGVPTAEVIAQGDCFGEIMTGFAPTADPEEDKAVRGRITTIVLKELLDLAEGKYPGTKNEREGIVIRPRDEVIYSDKLGDWLSFKVISNKFLLNEKE